MTRKRYVQTEEHHRNATEAIREFYASPASEIARRKISESVRSRPPVSKETRERMSKGQILRYNTQPHAKPNLGKELPKEWCSKISKGFKQYYNTHTVNNKGKRHSPETKKKISDTCKRNGIGKWNKGEYVSNDLL